MPVPVLVFVSGLGSRARDARGVMRPPSRLPLHEIRTSPASTFESSSGARQMGLENEAGVYDEQDIEETMNAHLKEVRSCYERAGHAQRYAAGKVTLRFTVTGDGSPLEVLVVANELGNFDVERCVVQVC